jgi:hypothetical protein
MGDGLVTLSATAQYITPAAPRTYWEKKTRLDGAYPNDLRNEGFAFSSAYHYLPSSAIHLVLE